jgi:outer membrane biosynthesis protein TonB
MPDRADVIKPQPAPPQRSTPRMEPRAAAAHGLATVPQTQAAQAAQEAGHTRSLTAAGSLEGLHVRGPLSASHVRHGLARVSQSLNECYADAARRAGHGAASQVHVSLTIDEAGRVKNRPQVDGAELPGLSTCLSAALGRLVCRAPDTGTATAALTLRFER